MEVGEQQLGPQWMSLGPDDFSPLLGQVAPVYVVPGSPQEPETEWLESAELPDFRVRVQITSSSGTIDGSKENNCIADALCVSGTLTGRPEAFVRVTGPKPNGFLWPIVVKFTPAQVEVWIEQMSSGEIRYYKLDPASRVDEIMTLDGLADKMGFAP